MNISLVRHNSLIIDKFICFAVFIQSTISILQLILISAFLVDPDTSTTYRVILTAIPMSLAILLSFLRMPKLFVLTYLITIFVLFIHSVIFPQNVGPILRETTRFLLPVIIPSALCIITVKDIDVVGKTAYFMSWVSAFFATSYVILFFLGFFVIDDYNMSFTFSCLLPMLILYNHKTPLSLIVSLFLFLVIIAIGSRGGALVFFLFVVFDLFRSRSKYRWAIILIGFFAIILLPTFEGFLDSIGISSRTITRFQTGELATSQGREALYPMFIQLLLDNPFLGIGLYGDRLYTEGSYCHNIFLEILLDFGIPIGTLIILSVFYLFVRLYRKIKGEYRSLWLIFFFCGVVALMPSGSYLLDFNFDILIGYTFLLRRKLRY